MSAKIGQRYVLCARGDEGDSMSAGLTLDGERESTELDPGRPTPVPGFASYTTEAFSRLRKQHNIMVLVGNGFDIQVLRSYGQPVDTRYEPFYHHLKMQGFNPANLLLRHMEEALSKRLENWSDIEAAVAHAVERRHLESERIFDDLRPIQAEFAQFLQGVVPSSLLSKLGDDAVANKWSMTSLSSFLSDLRDGSEFRALRFPREVAHYDLYNFLFVNFNYTTLLDDYVYLDQIQFHPRLHRTVDTNFTFRNDPRGHLHPSNVGDAGQSGYVLTEVVHPHGVLSTPRSLLFGMDAEDDYDQAKDPYNKLKKPYWTQGNIRYRGRFPQTELFIIFGCSLGDSDGWWWRSIAKAMSDHGSELIIYRRQDSAGHTVDSVRDRFLKAAGVGESDRSVLASRIHVALYEDSTERVFLNTPRPPGTRLS